MAVTTGKPLTCLQLKNVCLCDQGEELRLSVIRSLLQALGSQGLNERQEMVWLVTESGPVLSGCFTATGTGGTRTKEASGHSRKETQQRDTSWVCCPPEL